MDRSHWSSTSSTWRSPGFRERSPHPRQYRFRGDGGFGIAHQSQFSPQWRPRNQSPYRPQNPVGNTLFSPQQPSPYEHHDFMTSTPYSPGGRGRRPYHRGGGGGRFNKRHSFGSPSFDKSSGDDIESWISPEMWSDPWRYLTNDTVGHSCTSQIYTPTTTPRTEDITKFAETDFESSETELKNKGEDDGEKSASLSVSINTENDSIQENTDKNSESNQGSEVT